MTKRTKYTVWHQTLIFCVVLKPVCHRGAQNLTTLTMYQSSFAASLSPFLSLSYTHTHTHTHTHTLTTSLSLPVVLSLTHIHTHTHTHTLLHTLSLSLSLVWYPNVSSSSFSSSPLP